MKIAVISDTHDRLDMIRRAVDVMEERHIETIIHCGDFIAPFTIPLFEKLGIPFISVFGNNDGEKKGLSDKILGIGGMVCYPPVVRIIEGKQFLICHEPLPEEGVTKYFNHVDYYLFGHTHKQEVRAINGIKAINPGEICAWLTEKSTFTILDPDTGEHECITL